MHVGLARQTELGGEVDFGPTDDLTAVAVDHCTQQFARLVIQQPDAVGRNAGIDCHGTGGHDVVAVAIIRGSISRFAIGKEEGGQGRSCCRRQRNGRQLHHPSHIPFPPSVPSALDPNLSGAIPKSSLLSRSVLRLRILGCNQIFWGFPAGQLC
jgi:hypothetical protein